MRGFILILAMGLLANANAQSDSLSLKLALYDLDQALLKKDSVVLFRLLDKDLSFAHSNGWVQSRQDVWNDFRSGRLHYSALQSDSVVMKMHEGNLATITMRVTAVGSLNGKDFSLRLAVMQVWRKEKNQWYLLSRQSAKLDTVPFKLFN